ncbi:MAG: hypothetical protein ACOYPR_15375, partial [Saprospiraceae bacterium]
MSLRSCLLLFLLFFLPFAVLAQADDDDLPKAAVGKPITMPYNRAVHSAGKVITFGNPRLENHTLDVAL